MYDYVITGGTIVDGKRTSPYRANLCVQDGRIAAITTEDVSGRRTLDATGKIVSPGFIDIHTHSDPLRLSSVFAESKLFQGVTFELGGNCGISLVPTPRDPDAHAMLLSNIAQNLSLSHKSWNCEARDVHGLRDRIGNNAIHLGTMIGHGTLRSCVMGYEMRDPTPAELDAMCSLLDEQLRQGAFGLTLGLIYPPGSFCGFDELVALARVVKAHDRFVAVHMRNENERVFEALDEMIELTRKTGVRMQISHLKLMGVSQWGGAEALLDKIRAAKAEGLTINADQYPYTASSTSLGALLPKRAHAGGVQEMLARLRDPAQMPGILAEACDEMNRRGGPDRVQIAGTSNVYPMLEGLTIAKIAEQWEISSADATLKLLLDCGGRVDCIYHSMSEADMLAIMKEPFVAAASDGRSYPIETAKITTRPHRRSFGTFPMFLQTVREHKLMPVEDAVYKITGLPAGICGLTDRGVLELGLAADLTVWDWEAVADCSDYINPVKKPQGIDSVFVEGIPVVLSGARSDVLPGRFLLHPSASQAD